MKHRHLLALLQNGYTTVQVMFPGTSRQYTYKARGKIEIGDTVVVDSPRQGLTLVQVVGVDPTPRIDVDADFTYKWIVQKVDMTEYNRVLETERQFADTMQEIERIRQRELLMQQFKDYLEPGSEARKMFDNTVTELLEGSKPVDTTSIDD